MDRKVLGIIILVAIVVVSLYIFLRIRGPVCGNNVCEYFETPTYCCKDCGCYPGSICNKELNKCEKRVFGISDEEVKEIIQNYYNSTGKKVVSIRIADIVNVGNDKIGRRSVVLFEPEDWKTVIVTEDGEVIEEKMIA